MKIARVAVDTPDRSAFRADICVQPLPGLIVSQTSVAPCSLTRTPSLLRDDDDSLVFVLNLDGDAEMRFDDERGRSCGVKLPPGAGTLVSNHRRGGFFSARGANTCSLRLDRQAVQSFAPRFDSMILCEARAGDPSLVILKAYLQALVSARGGLSAAMAKLAEGQIRELLAHFLNPTGELARGAHCGGVKAARLRAILDDIAAHLDDPGLNAHAVGLRLGLSARYVQILLDLAGMSFSDHVRAKRLERARQLLIDPKQTNLRIADICAKVGFNDLSNFNRRYREHFGETPTDARRR